MNNEIYCCHKYKKTYENIYKILKKYNLNNDYNFKPIDKNIGG